MGRLSMMGGGGPGIVPDYGTDEAILHARFDGNTMDRKGSTPTVSGGVIYRAGKSAQAVQVAEGTINLMINPSVETATSPYARNVAATLSRSSDYAYSGSYSLKVIEDGLGFYWDHGILTAAVPYTLSFHVRKADGSAVVAGDFTALTLESQNLTIRDIVNKQNGWYRVICNARTATGSVDCYGSISMTNGLTVYYDALQLEAKAYATPYLDGSLGDGHAWSGTAHASTSERTGAVVSYPTGSLSASAGTVMCWLNVDSYDPSWAVIWQAGVDHTKLICDLSDSGQVYFVSVSGASELGHQTTLTKGVWHHIACTWDATANAIHVYVDGVMDNSAAAYSAPTLGTAIGAGGSPTLGSGYAINGLVDDFVVLPRALTAQEVAFYASVPRYWPEPTPWYLAGGIPAANCVAAYRAIGAPTQAVSYLNQVNPATHAISAPTAPTWTQAAGWSFNGVDQYLATDITTVHIGHGTGTFILRYSDRPDNNSYMALTTYTPLNEDEYYDEFALLPYGGNPGSKWDCGYNGMWDGASISAGADDHGVLGFAGHRFFRDGEFIAEETGDIYCPELESYPFVIAADNYLETIGYWCQLKVQAVAFYNTQLTDAQMIAVMQAMAALTE